MGMTDNENPIGLVPFLNPGFGIGAFGKRRKRSTVDPDIGAEKIAGGERYVVPQFDWDAIGIKKMCKTFDKASCKWKLIRTFKYDAIHNCSSRGWKSASS